MSAQTLTALFQRLRVIWSYLQEQDRGRAGTRTHQVCPLGWSQPEQQLQHPAMVVVVMVWGPGWCEGTVLSEKLMSLRDSSHLRTAAERGSG